jgi:hypothetical protein
MNAREAMLALLDGKTLYHHIPGMDVKYRLNKDNQIEQITEGDIRTNVALNWIDGIVGEYPLTFKDAMKEAMKGKRVANEYLPEHQYCFGKDGQLMCDEEVEKIYAEEIKAKWRVVE